MSDPIIPSNGAARPLRRSESRPRMVKADLRKADDAAWREKVGQAIARVQQRSGLSLKEFAAAIQRNERQVARWFSGAEHAQLATLVAVPPLRQLLIVALAELVEESVEITTAITIRRIA
jgi:ribosome-binding protein aMBF1 (putative translation factor)